MTVVCYDSKTLASDSMVSYTDGTFSHNSKKLFRLASGSLLGTAGDSDCREVIKLLHSITSENDFPERKVLVETRTEFSGLLVLPTKKVYHVDIQMRDETFDVWMASIEEVPSRYAIGHGGPFAMVVLDMGGSAEQAVKAAIKRSVFCGGPLQTMTLGERPKIKKSKKKAPVVDTEAALEVHIDKPS